MSQNTFLTKGIEIVKEAIKFDNEGNYDQAYIHYKKCLEYMINAIKFETNPTTKQTLQERFHGYLKRAEELKKVLDEGKESNNNGGGGGDSSTATASKDSKDNKDDDEKNKLRGALASAILTETPNVAWDDVAGLEGAKEALKEAVILPVKFKQFFVGKRKPWKGILLYGPPGTGKSFLAKAVATEANCKFFSVSSSDLVSKWQGESERLVRNLFEMAREAKHAIIFIDEIDSLAGNRSEGEADSVRRIKTEFLVQMDGVGKTADDEQILVLGATNIPWELDPAMRRRFEKRVYIPLPDAPARATMFKLNLGKEMANSITEEQFQILGRNAEGCSGADISIVTREALMEPVRKCQMAHFFRPCPLEPGKTQQFVPHCPLRNGEYHFEEPVCLSCERYDPTKKKGGLGSSGDKGTPCRSCKSYRCSLYDLDSDELKVPDVQFEDFEKAVSRIRASVSSDELTKFEDWTKDFGQEG